MWKRENGVICRGMGMKHVFKMRFKDANEKKLFYISLLVILGGWFYMYHGIFSVIHLGHDEAGQIWISKGLNHHSPTFATEGGLKEVYQNNNTHNLDPGLFSYLLHFWMKLGGDGFLWLKLLPLLFWGLFLFFFYHLMRLAFNDPIAPLLAVGLFSLSNVLLTISINIRAYSMEYAVSYGLFLFLFWKHKRAQAVSYRESLLLGLLGAIFLWSRYTFSITIAVVALFLRLFNPESVGMRVKKMMLFGLPIIISLIVIYTAVLSVQLDTIQAPVFYHSALIKYQGIQKFFIQNFLSLRALPSLLFLLVLVGVLIHDRVSRVLQLPREHALFLLFLIVSIHSILIIYSHYGLNPWSIQNPRSGHLVVFGFLGIGFMFSKLNKWLKPQAYRIPFILLSLLLASYLNWNKREYRHSWLYHLIEETQFRQLSKIGYTTIIPEYKYHQLKDRKSKQLPTYSIDEQQVFLEDSRAIITEPKTILIAPKQKAVTRGMFECYEVNVVLLE